MEVESINICCKMQYSKSQKCSPLNLLCEKSQSNYNSLLSTTEIYICKYAWMDSNYYRTQIHKVFIYYKDGGALQCSGCTVISYPQLNKYSTALMIQGQGFKTPGSMHTIVPLPCTISRGNLKRGQVQIQTTHCGILSRSLWNDIKALTDCSGNILLPSNETRLFHVLNHFFFALTLKKEMPHNHTACT